MSEFKIVYAIDDNVYKLAAVSMASVLLNNINSDIEFIILQSSLCQEAFAEFNKLKKIKDFKLSTVTIEEDLFQGLPTLWLTVTAWFRFVMAEKCPDIDKVLYLDCDTICRGNLGHVWEQSFEDNAVIAAQERNDSICKKLNLKSKCYFNSGVMLCNLKKWREQNITQKLFECAHKYKSIVEFPDQDILNIVLDHDKKIFAKDSIFLTYDRTKSNNHIIVHFIGIKPDSAFCRNRYRKDWWHYAKYTSFLQEFRKTYNETKLAKFKERLLSKKEVNGRIELCFLGIKIAVKKRFFNIKTQ